MWYAWDIGRYTVQIAAMGLRPSRLGLGGRARKELDDCLALPDCGSPPTMVKAAACAKNLRREQRRWRSCMARTRGRGSFRYFDSGYHSSRQTARGRTDGIGRARDALKLSRDTNVASSPALLQS